MIGCKEIQSHEIIMERGFNDKRKLSLSFYTCLRYVMKIRNHSGYVLRSFKEQSDFSTWNFRTYERMVKQNPNTSRKYQNDHLRVN
jgi:hypothetical protein